MEKLSYHKFGEGSRHIVLLHGYCEGVWVWQKIIPALKQPAVIWAFDLPGFGNSAEILVNPDIHHVAEIVWNNLDALGITAPVLIGHSLGGYVAMAMAQSRPEKISGLCLFHSTPFADSEERKQIRNRVIESVTTAGAKPFLQNFVTGLFHQPSGTEFDWFKKQSEQTSARAIIFYAALMRDRPDFSETLKSLQIPVLILAGKYDAIIQPEVSERIAGLSGFASLIFLNQSAHMGMLEEISGAGAAINSFLKCVG
jgi:pimeloyl-ACP methyl ester carboxylesterase